MSELRYTFEKWRQPVRTGMVFGGLLFLLTGVKVSTNVEATESAHRLSFPLDRIDRELGKVCLDETPYDPIGTLSPDNVPAISYSFYKDGKQIIVLTPSLPAGPEVDQLLITGFEHPDSNLKPVGEVSRQILEDQGCTE